MTPIGVSPDKGLRVRFPKIEFFVVLLPVVLIVLAAGYYFAPLRKDALMEELKDKDSTRPYLISGFIGAEIFNSLYHLRALSTESTAIRALSSHDPRRLTLLKFSFLTLALRNKASSMRWMIHRY
jgi:hypothetical protein